MPGPAHQARTWGPIQQRHNAWMLQRQPPNRRSGSIRCRARGHSGQSGPVELVPAFPSSPSVGMLAIASDAAHDSGQRHQYESSRFDIRQPLLKSVEGDILGMTDSNSEAVSLRQLFDAHQCRTYRDR